MGRKRKIPDNIIQLNFFSLSDHVSLDTKPFYVPQYIEPKPDKPGKSTYAEIISTRVWRREPRLLDAPIPRKSGVIIYPNKPGYKFCGNCGEWVDRLNFTEDKRPEGQRNRDGLLSWCKPCRARHAKRLYWLQKEASKQAA